MQSTSFRRLPIHVAQRAGWVLDLCGIVQQGIAGIQHLEISRYLQPQRKAVDISHLKTTGNHRQKLKRRGLGRLGIGHLAEGEDI